MMASSSLERSVVYKAVVIAIALPSVAAFMSGLRINSVGLAQTVSGLTLRVVPSASSSVI
jgi:hypothetical protein